MAKPTLFTESLQDEYEQLFKTCKIKQEKTAAVDALVAKAVANEERYTSVAEELGIPWWFVAVVHSLESDMNFKKHLHNGNPLTARTVDEPKGRPLDGKPPFTWEDSALDALVMKNLDSWDDWSVAGTLFQLERYNGFGYRNNHPEVKSPYLWSFSNHYTQGKFVKDRVFSPTAVSAQCGAAVLFRRMIQLKKVNLSLFAPAGAEDGAEDVDPAPLVSQPPPVPGGLAPAPIRPTPPALCRVTNEGLNVRTRPDKQSGILGSLGPSERVVRTGVSEDGGWWMIETAKGLKGWSSAKFLALVKPDEGQPAAASSSSLAGGNFPWVMVARGELDVQEVEGPKSNPRILTYLATTSLSKADRSTDATPWCSAFVNFCMREAGFPGTGSAAAISWLKYGRKLDAPIPGCIAVFTRPKGNHVAFYVEDAGDRIRVLGGNQGDQVSIAGYLKARLLGFRMPNGV